MDKLSIQQRSARYAGKGILVGYYKDKEHLQWILGNNDRGSLV